jgi:hypothetical protein
MASVRVLERKLKIRLLVAWDRDWIHTGVTGGAVGAVLSADGLPQAIKAEIRQAVSIDELANLFERVGRADQF